MGKIARIMPRIQLHPCGRYSMETVRAGREAMAQAYLQRVANLASPAQAITEALMQESLHSTYEHLPCRKQKGKSAWSLRDIMLRVDKDVAAGSVMTHAAWVGYWDRYMAARALIARVKGRRACRAQGLAPTWFAGRGTLRGALHAEWRAYYATHPDVPDADDLRRVHVQRMRKQDWRERRRDKGQASQEEALG